MSRRKLTQDEIHRIIEEEVDKGLIQSLRALRKALDALPKGKGVILGAAQLLSVARGRLRDMGIKGKGGRRGSLLDQWEEDFGDQPKGDDIDGTPEEEDAAGLPEVPDQTE